MQEIFVKQITISLRDENNNVMHQRNIPFLYYSANRITNNESFYLALHWKTVSLQWSLSYITATQILL